MIYAEFERDGSKFTIEAIAMQELDIKVPVRDCHINLRKSDISDIWGLGYHIRRDFVKLARKQQEKMGPGGQMPLENIAQDT